MKLRPLLSAVLLAAIPLSGHAATTHSVDFTGTGVNPDFTNVFNGALFDTPYELIDGVNTASTEVFDDVTDDDTSSFLGYSFKPSPATATFAVTLSLNDLAYVGTTVNLYNDKEKTDLLATDTIGVVGPFEGFLVGFAGVRVGADSPVWVELDWSGVDLSGIIGSSESFSYNLEVSPIPVPAGILLMGTALAGFGVMRRRKKLA